ncbi:MAG: arylesterase [Bacteroidetes bacterium HGW-Bacteroidetes-18]|nr:MAG: arylesterase [Bacteroidetes bacterium HGW-Bacteroidetes-18]
MRILLIFCYFLIITLSFSCGESPNKKEENNAKKIDSTKLKDQKTADKKSILFYGTSLTAGMGLDPNDAFPAVIQEKVDSLSLPYEVVNAGLSGETTAGGKNRINWVLNQKVDVFVLELGANDGLRGVPLTETKSNLQAIIDVVKEKNPDTKIVLVGMEIPPNMGEAYTSEFRNIFPDLAKKNKLELVPFLLKDVGGVKELNQQDGIHPTAEGQKILANNVWKVLKPVLTN